MAGLRVREVLRFQDELPSDSAGDEDVLNVRGTPETGAESRPVGAQMGGVVLSAHDGPLAGGGVVGAPVLVDAPVAGPLGPHARGAGRVPGAVKVGEIPAHKILVRLG